MKLDSPGLSIEKRLSPLFTLPVSRFKIRFTAKKKWRIYGMEPTFRGRLGFNLKKNCCPFPGFQNRDCETCSIAGNCLYLTLFAPVSSSSEKTASGHLKTCFTPARPFVPMLEAKNNKYILNPGEQGFACLTLFGPAIKYCSLILEAGVTGLSSFPLIVTEVIPESPGSIQPDSESITDRQISWPLAYWTGLLHAQTHTQNTITLNFLTPASLSKNRNPVLENFNFPILIQAVIRRLRDLKRAFNMIGDMGNADKNFFGMAEKIETCEKHLYWSRRKRYSAKQGQDVFLNGLKGWISFTGDIGPFMPLLKAGELVHIGKGTSAGNGRILIVSPQP